MRSNPLAFSALFTAIFSFTVAPPASAETYPVCMAGGFDSRALHCDFSDFDQCRATASGIGGSCIQNPDYHPGPPAIRGGPTKRRH
jgi:hypothetical protein